MKQLFRPSLERPALLAFLIVSAWAAWVSIGIRGVYSGVYNHDVYLATGVARYYLHRPDQFAPLVDSYTQGFVHALVYVPLMFVFELIGVPFPVRDGWAIGIVYAFSMGMISLLTFLLLRRRHSAGLSFVVALLVVASVLAGYNNIDLISPNGEILGSVLLLLYLCLLCYRDSIRGYFFFAVVGGVAAFHLKYQLLPQLVVLTFLGGLKFKKSLLLLFCVVAASLMADFLAYRLSGMGICSRLFSFVNDYGLVGTKASPLTPLILAPATFWPITFIYPLFLAAWIFWLFKVISFWRPAMPLKFSVEGLRASLVLTLATFFAIILPGKYFYHYYLLLLPTSVVVINYALIGVQGPAKALGLLKGGDGSRLGRKIFTLGSLSFLLVMGVLLIRTAPSDNPYAEAATLLLPEERSQGAHLYGWSKEYVYGSYGTYPFNPRADISLALSGFSGDLAAYNAAIAESPPPYIIDLVAVGKADNLQSKIKPLRDLQNQAVPSWVDHYKLIRSGAAGYVYKRIATESLPSKIRTGA